jgi:probable F420-dependent oxidoreductase
MDVGVVLQTTPPSARVIDLAKRAETYGFSHVWTFDSHILWQEPFPIFTQILAQTRNVMVGPMVTNPTTRDWTVTASLFATLNEMFGNRTVIGIGRGDSAVRVINGKPTTLIALRDAIHVIRELANGRGVGYRGSTIRFPWAAKSRVEVWVAGYGPKALQLIGETGDGFILQLADPDITAWTIGAVRKAAEESGRDPSAITICVAAPAYVSDDLEHARDQCRWFGGMVGNHVADIVARYGADGANVPTALTDYIKGREGYDYSHHGRVGNPDTEFVPDEIVERFCILGPVDAHLERLRELLCIDVAQREVPDLARVAQIGEVAQRVEIACVAVIPPVELQEVEALGAHAAQRDADRVLDNAPCHRARMRHPFGEGLDLRQMFDASLGGAALGGEAPTETADQILGRAVMIGEVPGGEPGVVIGEHLVDRARRVYRAMRPRHLPHPVEDAADREVCGEREAARCRKRGGKGHGASPDKSPTGSSGSWPGSSCMSKAVSSAAVPA